VDSRRARGADARAVHVKRREPLKNRHLEGASDIGIQRERCMLALSHVFTVWVALEMRNELLTRS
jgi:hypothetical protein